MTAMYHGYGVWVSFMDQITCNKPMDLIHGLAIYEKKNFTDLNYNNIPSCSGPTLELEDQVSLQSFKLFISTLVWSLSIIEEKSKAGLNILS